MVLHRAFWSFTNGIGFHIPLAWLWDPRNRTGIDMYHSMNNGYRVIGSYLNGTEFHVLRIQFLGFRYAVAVAQRANFRRPDPNSARNQRDEDSSSGPVARRYKNSNSKGELLLTITRCVDVRIGVGEIGLEIASTRVLLTEAFAAGLDLIGLHF